MKKVLMFVMVFVFVPFASFAVESLTDTDLSDITAQEGVTIVFDNVVISQTSGNTAWGDNDSGGAVFLEQSGATVTTLNDTALTIDVVDADATLAGLLTDINEGDICVQIGLPNVFRQASAKTTTIRLEAYESATYDVTGDHSGSATLGTMYQDQSTLEVVSGTVYIKAH